MVRDENHRAVGDGERERERDRERDAGKSEMHRACARTQTIR